MCFILVHALKGDQKGGSGEESSEYETESESEGEEVDELPDPDNDEEPPRPSEAIDLRAWGVSCPAQPFSPGAPSQFILCGRHTLFNVYVGTSRCVHSLKQA